MFSKLCIDAIIFSIIAIQYLTHISFIHLDVDSKTSTSSLSPPSSKQDQINVDDAFRDRRVISVSIDSCSHNLTRNTYTEKSAAGENIVTRRKGGDHSSYTKGSYTNKDDKNEGTGKVAGPVKTHRIVINLDDKNRFTDEVTV